MTPHRSSLAIRRAWCVPLLLLGACAPVEERIDVTYDTRFDPATRIDIYLPEDDRRDRPAILFVHGGGWSGGTKDHQSEDALRFARAGWVAASVEYRLVPDGAFPAAHRDVHCALAYVRANADALGIDPERIAVAGMSAGAHLVSLLGVAADDPDIATDCAWGPTGAPAAVISAAGPQDLRAIADAQAVQDFVGGTLDALPETYEAASPIHHVHPDAPPFLFIHGGFDVFVDIEQSRRMHERLEAVGVPSRILELPGGGHLLNPGTHGGDLQLDIPLTRAEAWPVMVDFLEQHVGGPDA